MSVKITGEVFSPPRNSGRRGQFTSLLLSRLSLTDVGPQTVSIEPSPSHVNVGMVAPDEPWRGKRK